MLFQLTMKTYITFTEYNITTIISKDNTVFFYYCYRKIRTLKINKTGFKTYFYYKNQYNRDKKIF